MVQVEDVVVDTLRPAVDAIERTDDVGPIALVEFVGRQEPEGLPEPRQRFLQMRRRQHGVRHPLHARGPELQPSRLADGGENFSAPVERTVADRDWRRHLDAVYRLDQKTVERIAQAYAFAPSWL